GAVVRNGVADGEERRGLPGAFRQLDDVPFEVANASEVHALPSAVSAHADSSGLEEIADARVARRGGIGRDALLPHEIGQKLQGLGVLREVGLLAEHPARGIVRDELAAVLPEPREELAGPRLEDEAVLARRAVLPR